MHEHNASLNSMKLKCKECYIQLFFYMVDLYFPLIIPSPPPPPPNNNPAEVIDHSQWYYDANLIVGQM